MKRATLKFVQREFCERQAVRGHGAVRHAPCQEVVPWIR